MNSFAALAEQNDPSEPASQEMEIFRFTNLVPDAKVSLQDAQFETSDYPAEVSLLACSSKYGYFIAGTVEGFIYGQTKALRSTFYTAGKGETVPFNDKITVKISQGPVQQLRLTADESQVIAAVKGGLVLIYNVKDIVANKENVEPATSFDLNAEILDLQPNPEALPDLAAVRLADDQGKIISLSTGATLVTIPDNTVTALCWSPKGKQIVVGRRNGMLQHYDTQGVNKDALPSPEEMRAGSMEEIEDRYVQDVLWVENHLFLVIYTRPRESNDDEHINDAYIIDRKASDETRKYIRLFEVTPVFASEGRGGHFYMETIRNLGREIQHAIILANSATSEVSVVGQDEDGNWATWILEENALANLPLSEETNADTFPLGLALDFSAQELLPPYDPSESDKGVDPVPVLYYLNDEGHMGASHCYSSELASRAEKYTGMTVPQDITQATVAPTTPAAATATASASAATTAPATSSFGAPTSSGLGSSGFAASPFGAALQQQGTSSSSFADLLSNSSSNTSSSPGAFGAPADVKIPSFRSLGSSQKVPSLTGPQTTSMGTPTFGSPSVPTFGAPTPVGFGQTTQKQSSPSLAPTLRSTGFGAFGSATTEKKSETSVPAFGSTSFAFGVAPATHKQTPLFGSFGTEKKTEETSKPSAPETTTEKTTVKQEPAETATKESKKTAEPVDSRPADDAKPAEAAEDKAAPEKTEPKEDLSKPSADVDATKPSSIFGQASTASSGGLGLSSTKSAFGPPSGTESSATPLFGSVSALGSSSPSKPAATTTTTSGATSVPAFGSTSLFGAAAKSSLGSAPSTTAGAPLFGSTSTLGATTAAPTFGSTMTLGSTTAKPAFGSTTPLASTSPAPAFGSTTSLGATTGKPLFGSTTTIGTGSGFGSALGTPRAEEPKSEPSKPLFGESKPSPLMPEPKSAPAKAAPASVTPASAPQAAGAPFSAAPAAPTTTAGKEEEAAKSKKKYELTAKEGMAREFESLYFTVMEEFEDLSIRYHVLAQTIEEEKKTNVKSKTATDLRVANQKWALGDAKDVPSVVSEMMSDVNRAWPKVKEMKETIERLDSNILKLRRKEQDINKFMPMDKDPKLVKIAKERPLDEETQSSLERLENRSSAYGNLLADLESKVHDSKKRAKAKKERATEIPNLYALHRAVSDIERDIVWKDIELKDVEEELAQLRIKENGILAFTASNRIAFEDISDSEDEEESVAATTPSASVHRPVSENLVQYTTAYLRRERFLEELRMRAANEVPK